MGNVEPAESLKSGATVVGGVGEWCAGDRNLNQLGAAKWPMHVFLA